MTREEQVLRLIGQIYDAAGSPDQWAACLASLRECLHGTAAHLLHHDCRSFVGGIGVTTLDDPAVINTYNEHFVRLDPWVLKIGQRAVAGQVFPGQSLVSHLDMVKTEYYADFGRRNKTTRTLIGFLEASPSIVSAALSINRADADSEFDAEEVRLLETLVPHLRRALVLHRRLTNIDAQRAAAVDVIDRLTFGVVLVDRNLKPVLVNQVANRLLAQRDGLVLRKSGLQAGSPALTRSLNEMLAAAAAVTDGSSVDAGEGILKIPRPSSRRPLQIMVIPVTGQNEYAGYAGRAVVAVFITDPEETATPTEEVLRHLHGLTPTEARVAKAIAEGRRVDQIAESLQLTRDTVRWYIKQALAKAGVATQAQLVRIVLSTPATK